MSPYRRVCSRCFLLFCFAAVLAYSPHGLSQTQETGSPDEGVTRMAQPDTPPITFIQITDAHLFDDGKRSSTAGEASTLQGEDWNALHWAILQTNHLIESGKGIDFVVFTGDLGLELVQFLDEKPCSKNNDDYTKAKTQGWPELLTPIQAAKKLVKQLRLLNVKVIYFLPGNNDLVGEDPCDLGRYKDFVSRLVALIPQGSAKVVDLSEDPPDAQYGSFRLLGLNSASFKKKGNYSKETEDGTCDQEEEKKGGCPGFEMPRLEASIKDDGRLYLIFTHVPDLKDPFSNDADSPECATSPQSNAKDSWQDFPTKARGTWNLVAGNPAVVGIFAGHFHSCNRLYYGTAARQTPLVNPQITSPEVAQKTWVAPPLAIKFQDKKNTTARGFLLVQVQRHTSSVPRGLISVMPFWYSGSMSFLIGIPSYIWVLALAAPVAIVLFFLVRVSRRSDASGQSPDVQFVSKLSHPVFLTVVGLLTIAVITWQTMLFMTDQLHVHLLFWLVPILGALGGVVGSLLRRNNRLFLCSYKDGEPIELGILGDVVVGMGGAAAVVFLFGGTLNFRQDQPNSLVLLISVSFIAGVVGENIVQVAGGKLLKQLAAVIEEQKAKKEATETNKEEGTPPKKP